MEEQSTIRKLIGRNVERQLVREYLLRETERAGFGGLTFNRTPEGTKISLRAEQVGRVIGRRGKVIHELSNRLKNDFFLDRPHLDVEEVTEPRLSAQIMASRLSSSLERGWFFRRAGHGTAQQIMDAGARGCLIVLSGKITGARHRVEKFQQGHIKFCGETALEFMDTGFSTAVKKLGTIGCTVKIMRPDAKLPHEIIITERADSGLPPLAEIAVFDASDEETVDELAAITEEAQPETDAEGVVDSVVDMMAEIESNSFWSEATKQPHGSHEGEEGILHAQSIGVPGAWTLKHRQGGSILVGGIFLETSDYSDKELLDEKGNEAKHAAVCDHGTFKGASTRVEAISFCRTSPTWCDECSKFASTTIQEEE